MSARVAATSFNVSAPPLRRLPKKKHCVRSTGAGGQISLDHLMPTICKWKRRFIWKPEAVFFPAASIEIQSAWLEKAPPSVARSSAHIEHIEEGHNHMFVASWRCERWLTDWSERRKWQIKINGWIGGFCFFSLTSKGRGDSRSERQARHGWLAALLPHST